MKRLIKTLLFACIIFCLTGFSVSAQAVPDAYKPIIEKYIYGLNNINEFDKNALGDFGGGAWSQWSTSLLDYGYCLSDLDGNGIPELLTECIPNRLSLATIYTIENNVAKKVALYPGGDSFLYVTGDIPGYPEESNCILRSNWNNFGQCYNFYKLNGSQLIFKVGYTVSIPGGWYKTNDESNPLQTSCSALPQDVIYNQRNLNLIPFAAYDPAAKMVEPAPAGSIYRLYNKITDEHLYTPDYGEAYLLTSQHGWTYENIGWTAPVGTGEPVYRLYNPVLADHLYSTDKGEVDILIAQYGWQADNNGQPLFYSGGSIPIFRLYNPLTGRHHLTKDQGEYAILPSMGWNQEGQKMSCIS